MKKITQEEINMVINTVYQLNISAKDFQTLKDFFDKLPAVDEKVVTKK